MRTLDSVPTDVLIEIFLRLSIETLVGCTLVCKSWNDLIKSPFFISLQMQTSASSHYFLVRYCKSNAMTRANKSNDRSGENYSLHRDDDETFEEYKKFEIPFTSKGDFFRIVGICNGLLCLCDDQGNNTQSIILWNPTIKKVVTLPKPNLSFQYGQCTNISLGFGFDSLTDDYKVVRIIHEIEYTRPYQYGYGAFKPSPKVELYKLKSGVWRNISHLAPPLVVGLPQSIESEEHISQIYMNGATHWIAHLYNPNYQYTIILFDMLLEKFGEISLSENLADNAPWADLSLSVYRDMLSVVQHDRYWQIPCCTVWIMEEYGVTESWTQLYKIYLFRCQDIGFRRPLGLRDTGELLVERDDRYLISIGSQGLRYTITNLGVHSSPWSRHRDSTYVERYSESLVLLDRKQDYSSNGRETEKKGKGKEKKQRNAPGTKRITGAKARKRRKN